MQSSILYFILLRHQEATAFFKLSKERYSLVSHQHLLRGVSPLYQNFDSSAVSAALALSIVQGKLVGNPEHTNPLCLFLVHALFLSSATYSA